MNSKTLQSVALTRIQWAAVLITLTTTRQTATIEYIINELSEQLKMPLPYRTESLIDNIVVENYGD